jgi:signal transduction histidine kinase
MTKRVLLGYLTITLVVLVLLEVPLAIFYAQRERERTIAALGRDVSVIATLYEDALERGEPLDPRPAEEYGRRTGVRIVVVGNDGTSLVDTDQGIDRDFSTRPEIRQALAGTLASGIRSSDTLGTDLVYVAAPVASGGTVHGALRATLDIADVTERIHRFWFALVAIAAIVLITATIVGWGIARSVTRPLRRLNASAARFASGDLTTTDVPASGPPEVRALAETMSTMASRLDELLATQRMFVADASHQLRTPLTALRLRLENLQSTLPTASAAELDSAVDETERLASLVGDLLQLARAEEHPAVVTADLAQLARDRVDTWTAAADAQGVRLVADITIGSAPVSAVPGAIEQILDNLLDNAVNATPGGSVTVAVVAAAETTLVTVADDGPGLSDAEKHEATGRFWRGTSATPGTGLGLAIVEALATASGATIELEDSRLGGLAVTVSFANAREPASGSLR